VPTVLLDTCAIIWMVQEQPMAAPALSAIRRAAASGSLLVSPVSAWEVGLLATRRRQPLTFRPTPATWIERLLARPGIQPAPLPHRVAVSAAFLPGELHGDPADRLLIATARELGVPLVTRDRRILDYAEQGHVDVIAC
jgi:PIN domain nuclease of toxin-antitoxin system